MCKATIAKSEKRNPEKRRSRGHDQKELGKRPPPLWPTQEREQEWNREKKKYANVFVWSRESVGAPSYPTPS